MIIRETSGLVAAPYVPFHSNGQINLDIIQDYAGFLKDRKVSGVFVNGSTGESASLSMEERNLIFREWIRYQEEDFRVFLHVGTNSVEEARQMAQIGESLGAFAIASTGPGYFKPSDTEALVAFLAHIATAAPTTPFYYYHIPALNQNYLSASKVLELALDQIPTLAGMKYTYEDLLDFQLARQLADGKLDILYGRDETLICGLALGVQGGVGSTYNFMPELYLNLIEAFKNGDLDEANRYQLRAVRVIEAYGKYLGIPAGKVIMKELGLDLGAPRLPFFALNREESEDLLSVLKNQNVLGV